MNVFILFSVLLFHTSAYAVDGNPSNINDSCVCPDKEIEPTSPQPPESPIKGVSDNTQPAEPLAEDTPGASGVPEGLQTRFPFLEPTKYAYIESFGIHVFGSESTSDTMMDEGADVIERMVMALKNPEDQAKFDGHEAFFITDEDPALKGREGQRNTGGNGQSLFNEVLVCDTAVDTIRPDADPVYRAWDTPVHEFGHAIEHTLGLEAASDAVYMEHVKEYNSDVPREYFSWSVQKWFASSGNATRETMPEWEYNYLATIFSVEDEWVPTCSN